MAEDRCLWILEFSVFLEEEAHLEYNFVEIFFFGVVVRCVYFNGLVVLVDWIELLYLLQSGPALTEEFFAERSVEHNKILHSAYHFFQLAVTLAHKQLEDYFFKISQLY